MTDEPDRDAIGRLYQAMIEGDVDASIVSMCGVVRAWAAAGVSQQAAREMMWEIRMDFAGKPAEDDVLDALDLIEGWVPEHRKVTWQR